MEYACPSYVASRRGSCRTLKEVWPPHATCLDPATRINPIIRQSDGMYMMSEANE